MYFISILAVVMMSALLLVWGPVSGSMTWFLDLPSLFIILVFIVTMLLSTGLLKDFNNAFRLIVKKNAEKSAAEIRRAIEAVALARKVTVTSGGFTMLFTFVLIMARLDDPSLLGPNLAVGILTFLYALAITLILLPLETGLRLMLHDMPQG